MFKSIRFFLLLLFVSSSALANSWQVGGLYSVPYESGQFVVIKILKTDSVGLHLRLYSNVFKQRPFSLDESKLIILEANNQQGLPYGAKHVAVSHLSFKGWKAEFIQQSSVSEAELTEFHNWHETKGGFF